VGPSSSLKRRRGENGILQIEEKGSEEKKGESALSEQAEGSGVKI